MPLGLSLDERSPPGPRSRPDPERVEAVAFLRRGPRSRVPTRSAAPRSDRRCPRCRTRLDTPSPGTRRFQGIVRLGPYPAGARGSYGKGYRASPRQGGSRLLESTDVFESTHAGRSDPLCPLFVVPAPRFSPLPLGQRAHPVGRGGRAGRARQPRRRLGHAADRTADGRGPARRASLPQQGARPHVSLGPRVSGRPSVSRSSKPRKPALVVDGDAHRDRDGAGRPARSVAGALHRR